MLSNFYNVLYTRIFVLFTYVINLTEIRFLGPAYFCFSLCCIDLKHLDKQAIFIIMHAESYKVIPIH